MREKVSNMSYSWFMEKNDDVFKLVNTIAKQHNIKRYINGTIVKNGPKYGKDIFTQCPLEPNRSQYITITLRFRLMYNGKYILCIPMIDDNPIDINFGIQKTLFDTFKFKINPVDESLYLKCDTEIKGDVFALIKLLNW